MAVDYVEVHFQTTQGRKPHINGLAVDCVRLRKLLAVRFTVVCIVDSYRPVNGACVLSFVQSIVASCLIGNC